MLIDIFCIFFLICLVQLILVRIKININLNISIILFYTPLIVLLFNNNVILIDKLYYLTCYSILFVTYYFTILGIVNDSPSLIIIREILKNNNKIKIIKRKFLNEKLFEKRLKELKEKNYIYEKNKYYKIKSNKIFVVKFFNALRIIQNQENRKNG